MEYEDASHYELLEHGRIIAGDVYCQKLHEINEALRQNYPTLVNRQGHIRQKKPKRNKIYVITDDVNRLFRAMWSEKV